MTTMPQPEGAPKWTIGDRLAKARRHAGLSVQEMAAELDVDRRTISRYENDQKPVRRSILYAYSFRTGVPAWWLAGVKVRPLDGMSAHGLRRTCASDVLDRGANIRQVQELLGHSRLSSTERYLRRTNARELRPVVEGRNYVA